MMLILLLFLLSWKLELDLAMQHALAPPPLPSIQQWSAQEPHLRGLPPHARKLGVWPGRLAEHAEEHALEVVPNAARAVEDHELIPQDIEVRCRFA